MGGRNGEWVSLLGYSGMALRTAQSDLQTIAGAFCTLVWLDLDQQEQDCGDMINKRT